MLVCQAKMGTIVPAGPARLYIMKLRRRLISCAAQRSVVGGGSLACLSLFNI